MQFTATLWLQPHDFYDVGQVVLAESISLLLLVMTHGNQTIADAVEGPGVLLRVLERHQNKARFERKRSFGADRNDAPPFQLPGK